MRKRRIGKAVLAGILSLSLLPFPGVTAHGEEAGVNRMLDAVVTTSSNETANLNGDKVKDGKFERTDRWASGYEVPTTNIWLKAEFEEATEIRQIDIYFFERDVAPMPSNVQSFSIKYTDEAGEEHYLEKDYENQQEDGGYADQVSILLDEAVYAEDITLCEFAATASSYNNVSIAELEVYSERHEEAPDLDSVAEGIQGETIETDVDVLPMPEVPEGYSVELNGADFEQIVSKDGEIVHPLTDKTVQISYIVTEEATGNTKETADIPYVIKGQYVQEEGMNAKPSIIPEIAEWYSDSIEKLDINTITAAVYDDPALESVVDEFILDYEDFTGIRLQKETGTARAGAYNFSLAAPDPLAGEEGYALTVSADKVAVQSESVTGNMYAMQTILQMYKQNGTEFPAGQMRDYPRFQTRGFIFDVARKPVSMDMIREVARTMRYYKMNDLHLHLSDNYIFLENYGKGENEDAAFDAYEAFRLESGLTNDKGESPTAKDYSISKDEIRSFIQEQRAYGVKVVPEIDVPAHSLSFTKIWPELKVTGMVSPTSTNRPLIDHLDVSRLEVRDKIKEIFDDYTKGENPAFDSETTVHIGADEFLADYTAYREFTNDLIPYIKETNTVRMWGGFTWIDDNKTEIAEEAIENVEMNLWSRDWSDGVEMYNMGFKLINTIDDYGYMVPSGSLTRANSYGDLLNIQRIFDSFEPNKVRASSGYVEIPSGDDQMLGAAFAIWGDNIDKSASGLSESDLYWRFFDAMPFYAEKTWAATGKEKGTYTALSELAAEQGTGPRTNPYYEEEDTEGVYEEYDFENGLADVSGNSRDLNIPEESGAAVEENALQLTGGTSYAETPIEKLGNENQLSFDIKLEKAAEPGTILFEADAPYGTHDIRIMEDGTLGFTRELYEYSFGYEIPVGETVNLTIVAEQQRASLYADGEFVSYAEGKFVHNGMVKKEGITNATFALPLERIGSKTNAAEARIDNVKVTVQQPVEDKYDKSSWTGTTNSETVYDDLEGLLEYAFDNDPATRWHSNWTSATDKLNGTNTFWAELDLGQSYRINRFSFTPRIDENSGQVTKADLYIKNSAEDEWQQVAADQTFTADKSKKTFSFETQDVRYIKFVAKESNDGWVAVSEFSVACKEDPQEPAGDISTAVLEYALELAENVDTEGVIDSVVEIFNNAKAAAQDILDRAKAGDPSVTQEMVDVSWQNLIKAMQYLSFKQGDMTDLQKVVDLANSLDLTKYLDAGQQEFKDALAAAEAVLAEEFTEQAEIDQTWKDLLKTMSELRLKPSKEALEALIASAENLSVEGADEETAAVFRSALANAVSVLDDGQATEAEVASAEEELQAAMSRMLASAGGSTDKPDGNTDNGGQQGSGPSDNGTASAGGSQTSGSGGSASVSKAVKTGDGFSFLLWAVLLAAVSAAGGVSVRASRRRR